MAVLWTFSYVVDDHLNVRQLLWGQPADFEIVPAVQLQEIVRAHGEKAGYLDQHINGRKDIVIFPVGDGLLGDSECLCDIDLTEIP